MEAMKEIILKIPSEARVAIATAIVTSLIAFIGVYFSNRESYKRLRSQQNHERQLRNDEAITARAEELYITVKKWTNAMVGEHFPYVRVMKGQFEYNKALDMTLSLGDKREHDPVRMHMICDLYFPPLSKCLDDLVELNVEALDYREEFKKRYERGLTKNEKMADIYLEKINTLIAAADALEILVADHIKAYNKSNQQGREPNPIMHTPPLN